MESATSEHFHWISCPAGREAKENNIFFVAQSPTSLRSGLVEGPMGLRRLAAVRCLLRVISNF